MKSAQCRLHVHIITFALSITNKFLGQLINPRHMREGYGTRSVCVTKLAPTYLVCESKVQCYKGSVWCSKRIGGLLRKHFVHRVSDSMTLPFNKMLCISHYIRHVGIINPRCMHFRHSCKYHWCWSPLLPSLLSSLVSFDDDSGGSIPFNSEGMYSCGTLWLAKLVCMHIVLGPTWLTCSDNIGHTLYYSLDTLTNHKTKLTKMIRP